MALTYYDMEKLMRMMYDQKLSDSKRKIRIARSKIRDYVPSHKRVPYRIRPSGATAE